MSAVFGFGRLLFVVSFIYAGVQKLMNVAATAALFANKVSLPVPLASFAATLEGSIGLSAAQFAVLLAGAIELGAAVLLALNVASRAMAVLLIIYPVAAIYYFSDFWHLSGDARENALADAMMNVSLIGGLVVFIALGSLRPGEPDRPDGV